MERFLQNTVGLNFFQGLRLNTLGHILPVNLLPVSFTENEEIVCLNEQSISKKEQKEVFANMAFSIFHTSGRGLHKFIFLYCTEARNKAMNPQFGKY